ncbi:MAG: hypothetical protein WCA98_07570 [Candidatus Acidiferrales bacterium]
MKKVLGGLGVTTLLTFFLLAASMQAQTAVAVKRSNIAPRYNVSKEVTLKGIVQGVQSASFKRTPGTLAGDHLMLSTSSGVVDTHLGTSAMTGPKALKLTPGEPVSVTGAMTTVSNKQIFLARTVVAGGQTYKIRNQNGALIISTAAVHPPTKTVGQGGAK